jgi:AcrR family transcriptional regulator
MRETSKGERTRSLIVEEALQQSTEVGLHGLSFGSLAKALGMSKSGLYAHFDGKEQLQTDLLDAAADRFVEVVIRPALAEPRGLPRIETLSQRWIAWGDGFRGGCPFIAAATELDARDGAVHDRFLEHLRTLLDTIGKVARTAVEVGHFRHDLDCDQFAYEFWANIVAHHHYERMLAVSDAEHRARRAFRGLIDRSRTPLSRP